MIHLSKLILNPRSRQVQHELADPYEMHRTVTRAFSGGTFRINRQENMAAGVLFRVDIHPHTGIPILLVQSHSKPDWSFLFTNRKDYLIEKTELLQDTENPAVKQVDLHFRTGQALAFRMRANPTVKKDREGKKQGRREGLVSEEEQLVWLKRKIEGAGGLLVTAQVTNKTKLCGKLFNEKDDDQRMHFISAQFDGILQVIDPELLLRTVSTGIGPAKAFGFGLLSLAPAN